MKKLLMALAFLPLMAAAADCHFEYTDNDDGTITLTGVSGTVPRTLKVPVQIEGKNVSAVGYGFMSKNQEISSIVISEGVRRIGEKAFCDCHSLESIEIPKSVTEIGDKAFVSSRAAVSGQTTGGVSSLVVSPDNEFFEVVSGVLIGRKEGRAIVACANVRAVSLPEGVTTICDMAFCGCTELKSIQFPSSLMIIEGDKNFGACFSLETVDFHKTSLAGVGEQAFALCKKLKTVWFPSTLKGIGSYAFSWCDALTRVQFDGREPIIVQVDKHDPAFPFGDIYVTSDSLDVSANGAGSFTKHLDRVITYVLPDMGWENAVAKGEWQGRPIRYVSEGPSQETFLPGEVASIDTGLIGYTASGLPSGLKYDKTTGMITGAATKPGEYAVKFTKSGAEAEEMTIIVGPMPKIGVALEGDTDGCKVTGAGAYLVGKKVTLKVTTKKGTAFAGFYKDGEPWPNESDCKKTSLAYTMGKEDVSLVAKFEKEKMSVGCVGLSCRSFTAGVAGSPEGIPLEIETQSGIKSVKVEKLPAGMKYDAKKKVITGAPTKAGDNTVVITVTAVSGAVEKKEIAVPVAAMPETAIGTFNGFVANGEQRIGTFTLTTTDAGKLTAKVITIGGTVSFSGTCWDSLEDGVCKVALRTKKGEFMTLALDSGAAWDANQLTGTYSPPNMTGWFDLSAQRNAFGKTWYFTAAGDEQTGWTFAYTKDAKTAALTVTLKADGSTAIAGKLGSIKISASGTANVGGMREGAIIADFAPIVTVNKVKRALSIHTNLWFDRSNDHAEGVGGAGFSE